MDAKDINNLLGIVLAALLLIFGGGVLIEELTAHHGHGKPAYQLVASADEGDASQAEADEKEAEPEGFSFAQVQPLLADASADAGKSAFKQCSACHTVNDGGANRVGPNLWGIVSRAKAAVDGFSYSNALTEKGGEWTYEDLALFLHDPKGWAPGTKMAYRGIKRPKDVANMLAYLQSLAAEPVPYPDGGTN